MGCSSSFPESRHPVTAAVEEPPRKLYKGVKVGLNLAAIDKFYSKFTGELLYKWRPANIVDVKEVDRSCVEVNYTGWASTFNLVLDFKKGEWKMLALPFMLTEVQIAKGLPLTDKQEAVVLEYLYTGQLEGNSYAPESSEMDGNRGKSVDVRSSKVQDFEQGKYIDILDIYYVKGSTEPVHRWRRAQILKVLDTKIWIHYCGCDVKYDEVLDVVIDCKRIRATVEQPNRKGNKSVRNKHHVKGDSIGHGVKKLSNIQPASLATNASNKPSGMFSFNRKGNAPASPDTADSSGGNNKNDSCSGDDDDNPDDFSSVASTTASEIEREAQRDRDFVQRMVDCGMTIVPIEGDGNCLFRAVSYQLFLDENAHALLRAKCVEHLKLYRNRFEMFCDKNFDEHVDEMGKLGVWGDDMEIRALEEILDRIICIYSADTPDLNRPINQLFEESSILNDAVPLKLSYHGSNHYNSVEDKKIKLPLEVKDTTILLDTRTKLFSSTSPRK